MDKICRVIFNFTNKCNLPCAFCYIPFNNIDARDLELWKRIVDKCKEFGTEIITFGGGDPFMYKDFPKLLEYAFDGTTFLQVDTNALALSTDHIVTLTKHANLIGVPLEGSEDVHNKMRGHPKHYKIVLNWIRILLDKGSRIKINTVLTKENYHCMDELADCLSKFNITKWSIYQFWALAQGNSNRQRFEISNSEYSQCITKLKMSFPTLSIEASSATMRHKSYFFVSHTGRVYVMNNSNQEEYIEIGNIFDNDILKKWEAHGDYSLLKQRAELRKEN